MADEKDQTIAQLLATNKALMDRLDAVESRLPPAPAAEVAPGTKLLFPTTVYRESTKEDQRDHPGHEAKVVGSQEELDAHLANGWHDRPQDEYPEAAKAPVVAKKTKATSKAA